MNCPRHPKQKMIALFTSWACDICDPPMLTLTKAQDFPLLLKERWWELFWMDLGAPDVTQPLQGAVSHVDYDVVIRVRINDEYVDVLKSPWHVGMHLVGPGMVMFLWSLTKIHTPGLFPSFREIYLKKKT